MTRLCMQTMNNEEQTAINALKEVAKIWPKSLWLFSASSSLLVMKKDSKGEIAFDGSSVDQAYSVEEIDIENDGGDF